MSGGNPPTLASVCEFIVDCLHATAPTELQGLPLIRTPNVGKGRLDLEGVYRVSQETYEIWTQRAVPQPGDLILAREAPAGNVALIQEGQTVCLGQRTVHIRPDRAKVDPQYLCYFLLTPTQQGKLLAAETGATAKHVNMRDIRRLDVTGLPSIAEQQRVAALMGAYDDLIENNRRRMALLEEAARQLYREWFVRLRFPGHEHTRFFEGTPDGWRQLTLGDLCRSLEDGDWIESKDQGGDDFRLLQISNIGIGDFVETGNFRFVSEETFKRLNCQEVLPGQILISRMPEPIGRAWLVQRMPWRMLTAVDVAIATANPELVDLYYLVQALNSPISLERCQRRAVGATRARIARRELATLPVPVPALSLQRQFRDVAEPIDRQRANLRRQNDALRTARDLLLPRLMTGEIAV